MSKFCLAKVRISESLLKVRMFLIITHGVFNSNQSSFIWC